MKAVRGVLVAVAVLGLAAAGTLVADACDGDKVQLKATTASLSSYSCSSAKAANLTASASSSSCAALKAGLTADCFAHCKVTNIVYQVGDTGYLDRAEALAAAEKSDAAVTFVALDKTYETEQDAQYAMMSSLYARLENMLAVSASVGGESYSCAVSAAKMAEKSGKDLGFTAAGRTFDSKDAAMAHLVKVKAAVEAIKLVDSEGNEVAGCAVGHCKNMDKKVAFKLGEKTIDNPFAANLAVAQEKVRVALTTDT